MLYDPRGWVGLAVPLTGQLALNKCMILLSLLGAIVCDTQVFVF